MDPPHVPPNGPLHLRSQSSYFYGRDWTKNHDKAFIKALYSQARQGHRQLSRMPNMYSLNYAIHAVHRRFGWTFNYRKAKTKLARLRLRYNTFPRLINDPGFVWLPEDNYLLAAEDHWDRILAEIPFANAYRLEDEPYYYELHAIFGDHNVGQPEAIALDHSTNDDESFGSNVTDE